MSSLKTFTYFFFWLKIQKEGAGCHWATTEMEVAVGPWLRKDRFGQTLRWGRKPCACNKSPEADEKRPWSRRQTRHDAIKAVALWSPSPRWHGEVLQQNWRETSSQEDTGFGGKIIFRLFYLMGHTQQVSDLRVTLFWFITCVLMKRNQGHLGTWYSGFMEGSGSA